MNNTAITKTYKPYVGMLIPGANNNRRYHMKMKDTIVETNDGTVFFHLEKTVLHTLYHLEQDGQRLCAQNISQEIPLIRQTQDSESQICLVNNALCKLEIEEFVVCFSEKGWMTTIKGKEYIKMNPQVFKSLEFYTINQASDGCIHSA